MNKLKNLYKYVSAQGAIETLTRGAILFRKPPELNDPFDVQPEKLIHISSSDMGNFYLDKVVREIRSGAVASRLGTISPAKMRLVQEQLQRYSALSDQDLRKEFARISETSNWKELIDDTAAQIRRGFNNCFVSCFTENQSSLLMWAHYAESHQGALLKFRNRPNSDFSLISRARKVQYSRNLPVLASKKQWLSYLKDPDNAQFEKEGILKVLTTKSAQWSYEKEWRVIVLPTENRQYDSFSIGEFAFDPMELQSVVLGCRMTNSVQSKVVDICRKKYPHIEIFRSFKSESKFRVVYQNLLHETGC